VRRVDFCIGVLACVLVAGSRAYGAPLASPFVAPPRAPVELAQRALQRPTDRARDTTRVGQAPGGREKSRGLAVAMAAVLPGSGQLYLGHRRGYAQLGAEALAWFAFASLQTSADDKKAQYAEFVGDATAQVSVANHWQFDRYCPTPADCDTTDYNDLLRQWQDDRTRFFESITDPRYARGWSDSASAARYESLRDQANRMLRLSRWATAVVVVNHVVSLIDAVQSTRRGQVSSESESSPLRVEWALAPRGLRGADGRAALVYRF
jgi:hypothetical protein